MGVRIVPRPSDTDLERLKGGGAIVYINGDAATIHVRIKSISIDEINFVRVECEPSARDTTDDLEEGKHVATRDVLELESDGTTYCPGLLRTCTLTDEGHMQMRFHGSQVKIHFFPPTDPLISH